MIVMMLLSSDRLVRLLVNIFGVNILLISGILGSGGWMGGCIFIVGILLVRGGGVVFVGWLGLVGCVV